MHGLLQPKPYGTILDPLTEDMDFHHVDVQKAYLLADDNVALPPRDFGCDGDGEIGQCATRNEVAVGRAAG